MSSLQKCGDKRFKYIHIGLVHVGIKSLIKESLNTSILVFLRDCRFTNFHDSLLSSIESRLYTEPIFFRRFNGSVILV